MRLASGKISLHTKVRNVDEEKIKVFQFMVYSPEAVSPGYTGPGDSSAQQSEWNQFPE